ncbi:MAG: reprolysin-like metallopeptidase [Polaribacter sp.]
MQKSVDKQLNKQEAIIELPDGNGNFLKYQLKEIFTLDKELAKKYPMIKSYVAVGIDNPNFSARISMGLDGFHALVKTDENGTLYIDPYTKDKKEYIVYKRADLDSQGKDFECLVNDAKTLSRVTQSKNAAADDVQLREFDLALACTGEYAQFHLTRQGISASATDATKKAAVLSAMNTSITRVNNVFEKDLSVTLKIIATNDNIIFLDGNTDNLTNSNEGILIDEIQSVIDTRIGSANYDIGHVFSTGDNAGVAIFESVCQTNQKSRGVTGRVVPVGDAFDIDFVAHEIGHQFGATHTYNNSCGGQRTNSTAVEPGSGSTIMAYAGICSPNVQSNSDDYFHTVSITQIKNYVTNSTTNCVTLKGAVNPAPVVNAGSDYNIPKSTPFVLRGNATDTNNPNSLTYNWEQVDTEIATMAPLATNSGGPMFRSLPSKIASDRYMPALQTVVAGNTSSTWEVVPSVTRNMDFALTVRDNDVNGGATSRDDMRVTVLNADPFTVSVPNASIIWDAGTTQTISWNKGTTDVAPINCSFVNIKLSVDGGLTFPITIKANTPNDGSEAIVVPNNVSTKARIMVEAADNIFYNVNAGNFTIQSTIPTFVLTNPNGTQFVCNTGNEEANFVLNFDFVNSFSENVTLSATLPNDLNGAIVTFSPTSLNADGNVTMNVKNLNGKTSKSYTINVQGTSNSVTNNINVDLNITQSSFNQVVLTSPTNGITGHSLKDNLQWVLDANASSYDVEVATDFSFTNIVLSGNVISNSYNIVSLQGNTTYYWRVKPKNSCGEGVFSNTFNFTTSAPYCLSTFTDEANGSEHITNVTFNTINNNSGNDTEDGYQDFSAISTNVKRGDSHQISVSFNTGDYRDHCYVFIDWNQDLVFNTTNERYDLGNRFDSNVADGTTEVATSTFTIPIPADAKFGSTGMRVIVEYFGDGAPNGEGPCDADHQSEWGETEDYTVVVDNPTSIKDVAFDNFNLYPNPTKGAFTLTLQLVNTDKTTLQLFDVRGRLIDEKKYLNTKTNFSEKIFFEKASAGLYLLRVINGGKQTTRKLIVN